MLKSAERCTRHKVAGEDRLFWVVEFFRCTQKLFKYYAVLRFLGKGHVGGGGASFRMTISYFDYINYFLVLHLLYSSTVLCDYFQLFSTVSQSSFILWTSRCMSLDTSDPTTKGTYILC